MSQADIQQDVGVTDVNAYRSATSPADSRLLGFVFVCGPVVWGLQLLVGYLLVSLSCIYGNKIQIYALSAATFVLTLIALGLAVANWRRYVRNGHTHVGDLDAPDDNRDFIITSGVLLSGIFLLLIAVTGIVAIFLSPCPIITMPIP